MGLGQEIKTWINQKCVARRELLGNEAAGAAEGSCLALRTLGSTFILCGFGPVVFQLLPAACCHRFRVTQVGHLSVTLI